MNVVSSNYKSVIDTSFALSPKYKVVIDNVEYLGDVIKEVPKISHSNTKFIGGFPTKNLSMEIYNLNNDLDIEDKEISVYKGFVINDTIEYVKQGVFIAKADKITTNISKKTITITNAQDRTQLLDDIYESSLDWSNDKTHTGLEIVQEICTKKGITLASNTFNFANYSFKQPNFTETTTNREVISRLAEIGGEIAFFNCDGNLVIKSQTITGDTINKHRYEKLSRENEFKVNTIVLGKDGVTDDIVYPKSITGDRVEFKILDNPFVDLYREEMIEEVASCIVGMSYIPYNLTNVVDGYIYELNDVVQIVDKNNETFNAVILDISNTSRFKSDIKAAVLSTPTTDYNLAGSKKEGLNKVKVEVDHANNRITALAEEVKDIEVETTLTKEANGNPIVVTDAGPYKLESIAIDGKSIQDGTPTPTAPIEIKNVEGVTNEFNIKLARNVGVITNNNDGTLTLANNTNSSGYAYSEVSLSTFMPNAKVGETYKMLFKSNSSRNATSIYLSGWNDYLTVGNTFELTQQMLDSKVVFYGGYNEVTTISDFIITKDIYCKYYVPYGGKKLLLRNNNNNYLQDINFYNWVNNSNATQEKIEDYIKVNMPQTPSSATGIYFDTWSGSRKGNWKEETAYLVGKDITYSFYAKADKEREIYFQISDGTARFITLTTEWKRYSVKIADFKNTQVPTFYCGNKLETASYYIKDIMLQEGELTDYVPYKETTALVDLNKENYFGDDVVVSNFYINYDGGPIEASDWLGTNTYIEVKPNTTYIVDGDNMGTRFIYAEYTDKNFASVIGSRKEITPKTSFTTTDTTKYIRFCTNGRTATNFKIYKGTETDDYYRLASIGDTKDTFENGVLTQRIGKVVLDGSENWSISSSGELIRFASQEISGAIKVTSRSIMLSNYFNYVSSGDVIGAGFIYNQQFFAYPNQDITTIADFKTWLSENNVEVYYPLATPIEHTLNYEVLELYEGYNNITTNDDLEPNMSITYLTDSKLNSQYATKSELKVTADNITSEINSTLKNGYTTIEQSNAIRQELTDKTNNISLEVSKKVDKTSYDTDKTDINAKLELKLEEKDKDKVVSMINASAEEINLTSNRFSLESDNLDISHDGSIKITSTDENTKFVVTNADETSKVHIVDRGILMTDDRSQLNVDIGGPAYIGAFNTQQAELKIETLEAIVQTLATGDSAYLAIYDNKGEAYVGTDKLEVGGIDVLSKIMDSSSLNSDGYVKFADGFMLQWKYASVTAGGTQWGNVYYSDHEMGNWATPFTTVFTAWAVANSLYYWVTANGYNSTSAGKVRCYRPNSSTATTGVRIMAIGRWK